MFQQVTFGVNQKIQVSRIAEENYFDSSVQDVQDGFFSIAIPYLKEHPLVLYRGEEVRVRFTLQNASYIFTSRVIGVVTDNIKLYKLVHPEKIERIQLRNHVRIPVMLDVEYVVKEAVKESEKQKIKFNKGTTVDLSGGGMKLATRENIKENSLLILKFLLPLKSKAEPLQLKAKVVRVMKADPQRELYHLGLRFEDITYREEDMIVRFVFERAAQQKRLR